MKTSLQIKRALLSVSDKTDIILLADALHKAGVEIISTGGTAKKIRDEHIPVTGVTEITGFKECLGGRVKTLHPAIHAAILGRPAHQPDMEELKVMQIEPIQLVVVNLYPFRETIQQSDCTPENAIEQIDIGGPTMIRAAAKNYAHVCVLTSPAQYASFIKLLKENGSVDVEYRREQARQAFNHTAEYDTHIANYFNEMTGEVTPDQLHISLPKSQELRYGENPHQKAVVYGGQNDFIECFHGKQLSYNNYLDVDAALHLISEFEDDQPTCAIFKHTVPCGAATADSLSEAWEKAFQTDTTSPFGGIVVVNKSIDLPTAEAIDAIFTEIIIAPSFSDKALELLQQKKNRRLIRIKKTIKNKKELVFRSIFGGVLCQEADVSTADFNAFKTVTKRSPDPEEIKNLMFAWKMVKHVKSNGIVYARGGQTIGIGTGQTSRVASSKIAIEHAREEGLSLENTAIASDAFFPFADGIEAAAQAGATSVIQPGGSIRDEEVIEAANAHNMAMVFTGVRYFKH